MTDVSIALATFNGARFLREQLSSYECQTRLPDELVVGDDGSSDKTLEIIAEFAKSAPFPVRILSRDSHLGFADNFLRTAKACNSKFIAFSDQDDVWLPRKLEEGLRRLEQDGSYLSLHTSMITDASLVPRSLHRQGIDRSEVYQALQLDPYVGLGWGNTMMFRRGLLEIVPIENRPKQPEADHRLLSHDTWIYVLAAALGSVSHIDEPLCFYRQHEGNSFGVAKRRIAEQIRATVDVPLVRHQCRAEFYYAMARIFDQLKSSSEPALAKAARLAAQTFEERHAVVQSRIRVYTGDNVWIRLREFLQSSRSGNSAPVGRKFLSQLKDLVLGVCGLGRLGDR
jgi:glycosyltransferase involved in cell wall biosynthesis